MAVGQANFGNWEPNFLQELGAMTGTPTSGLMSGSGLMGGQTDWGIASPGPMELPGWTTPKIGAGGAGGGGLFGTGVTADQANLALSGLNTIGNLYGAFKTLSLAKKQYKQNKLVSDTNIKNQISAYNTTLDDRIRSRAVAEGQSPEQAADYIAKNRLADYNG